MPASSQGLPTSLMRETVSPHFEQRILTASTQGRWGECPSTSPPPARRHPADLPRNVGDEVAQLAHGDEPLLHQPEDELAVAAPADRVAVSVVLDAIQDALLRQVVEDVLGDVTYVATVQTG